MEDYLEAIYHLQQEHREARSCQIAERMGVHKSTVSTALRHLGELELVHYRPYQAVTLTRQGRRKAESVVCRHRVICQFLQEVLGVEEKEAEENACRMEHAFSPDVFERFVRFVGEYKKQP
jgi:DtxR family Mn-dependent transcriptional regulator